MKKKLMIISAAGLLALGGLAAISAAGAGMSLNLVKAADHTASHSGEERAFYAPGIAVDEQGKVTGTGTIPYWRCDDCCTGIGPDAARYSLSDKTTPLSLEDVTIPKLTTATTKDIADGDEIANVNVGKFKYVDQGANGAGGKEGTSTPWYVKDTINGKEETAIYFSRSGVTGEGDDNCSEFRFAHTGQISSVTFSYRLNNWGTKTAQDGVNFKYLCQFYSCDVVDGSDTNKEYEGYSIDSKIVNDDKWHSVTIAYKEATSKEVAPSNFNAFVLKFADLRGYMMISGLTYETSTTVTLKNATSDGSDKTEKVSYGSLPTTPTMDGKKFLGWYDASGKKVDSVTSSNAELIAHWAIAKYSADNRVALDLTAKSKDDYGTIEGIDESYGPRCEADRTKDLAENAYSENYVGFSYEGDNGNKNTKSGGVVLPAIDFSAYNGVHFTFGFRTGVWSNTDTDSGNYVGVSLDGNPVGVKQSSDADGESFDVTIIGKAVSVHSKYDAGGAKDYSFELSEQTYKGEKGLAIQTGYSYEAWLLVSAKFISFDYDYLAGAQKIEDSLPDTPVAGYSDQIKEYQELRAVYTDYEKSAYSITTKMQSWIDAYAGVVLADFTNNANMTVDGAITGDENMYKTATDASKSRLGGCPVFDGDSKSFIGQISDLTSSFASIAFPAIDFSAYKTVSFSFGTAGNIGQYADRYFFLGDAPAAISDSANATNLIGVATEPVAASWSTAGSITATVSNGSITFKTATAEKTFTLDESINKGTAGLKLSFGNICWEYLVVSPVHGYQI